MRNKLPILFAILIAVMMIAGPLCYKSWNDREYRNFRVVEEGVLYRSGQLPLPRLSQLVANHGIRTIVCLREGNDSHDQLEEAWANVKSVKFVRIPPRSWYPDATGKIPGDASLKTFREVMDDPANYPVLVHCFAGIHRTGLMCAVFRMDYQHWSNDEAMSEMRAMGYTILGDHEDVLRYLTDYRSPTGARKVPALQVNRQIEPHP